MKDPTRLNYELMNKKALEQFGSGQSLYGKDGAFAPLLKSFLEAALEAEMGSHLNEEEQQSGTTGTSKAVNKSRRAAEH